MRWLALPLVTLALAAGCTSALPPPAVDMAVTCDGATLMVCGDRCADPMTDHE